MGLKNEHLRCVFFRPILRMVPVQRSFLTVVPMSKNNRLRARHDQKRIEIDASPRLREITTSELMLAGKDTRSFDEMCMRQTTLRRCAEY